MQLNLPSKKKKSYATKSNCDQILVVKFIKCKIYSSVFYCVDVICCMILRIFDTTNLTRSRPERQMKNMNSFLVV